MTHSEIETRLREALERLEACASETEWATADTSARRLVVAAMQARDRIVAGLAQADAWRGT